MSVHTQKPPKNAEHPVQQSTSLPQGRMALILGGARDGKSRFAEECARHFESVTYCATAHLPEGDEELAQRIKEHVARRPQHWVTLEPPTFGVDELVAHVKLYKPQAVVFDCATLWLGWEMTDKHTLYTRAQLARHLEMEVAHLVRQLASLQTTLFVVSNEVGLGVVPSFESGRLFRDLMGVLNSQLAAEAQVVCRMTAGIALLLKGGPHLAQQQEPGISPLFRVDAQWVARRLTEKSSP